MGTSTLIVLAIIVVVVLWAIGTYNGLVSMRQRVNQAFADIDVQLRQRHDLIPNLVETVKGYAAHERGTLEEVVKARNAAVAAQGTPQHNSKLINFDVRIVHPSNGIREFTSTGPRHGNCTLTCHGVDHEAFSY